LEHLTVWVSKKRQSVLAQAAGGPASRKPNGGGKRGKKVDRNTSRVQCKGNSGKRREGTNSNVSSVPRKIKGIRGNTGKPPGRKSKFTGGLTEVGLKDPSKQKGIRGLLGRKGALSSSRKLLARETSRFRGLGSPGPPKGEKKGEDTKPRSSGGVHK